MQKRIPYVIGDREVEVLHRLLDGDSMRAIGKHMRLSSTTIFRTRNNILCQMIVQKSGNDEKELKTLNL